MKKTILPFLAIVTLFLSSCGSSISSDAQKIADLQCKVKELQQKVVSGDISSQKDVLEYMTEAADLIQEMNSKYVSIEEKQEFKKALLQAQANCN